MKLTESQNHNVDESPLHRCDRSARVKSDRRRTNALLKSALLHHDLEVDVLDTSDLRHLPMVDQSRKRGKGLAYDRARSSEWRQSNRTELRRNVDEETARVSDRDLPQVKRHILSHRASISDIFSGHVLPGDRELARKELLRKKDKIGQSMEGKEGREKHDILLQIRSISEQIDTLWSGLEPYQRNAYWVFVNTRRKVAKARRKSRQTVNISKKGRKNRATRGARLSNFERGLWKDAKEALHRHNLAKGYEVES